MPRWRTPAAAPSRSDCPPSRSPSTWTSPGGVTTTIHPPASRRSCRASAWCRWTSTATWPASGVVATGSENFASCPASRQASRTISRAVWPPCFGRDGSTAYSGRCTRSCTTVGWSSSTGCSSTAGPTTSCAITSVSCCASSRAPTPSRCSPIATSPAATGRSTGRGSTPRRTSRRSTAPCFVRSPQPGGRSSSTPPARSHRSRRCGGGSRRAAAQCLSAATPTCPCASGHSSTSRWTSWRRRASGPGATSTTSGGASLVLLLHGFVFQRVAVEVGVPELGCRRFVDDDRDVRVQLKYRGRTACGDRTFDGGCDGVRLVPARRDEHQVPGRADRAQTLGDDVAGDLVDAREEPGIVVPGLLGERLDPCARTQRRAWLVEPDVPVGADPQELDVDGARFGDRGVVMFCGGEDVIGDAVGAVHARGVDVDVVGELLADDVRVGLRVTRRQAHVLVEQERLHTREVEAVLPMPADQLAIDRER